MPFDVDDVVVTRRFERDDGEVLLLVHKPTPDPKPEIDADPDDPPWRCFYTIRFPDGEIKHRSTMGIDGMQALLLSIAAAQGDLRNMGNGTPEKRPAIRWLGEGDLGLTVPEFD